MLDRVARLPARRNIAFNHVNRSCRAIPASPGEINHGNMAARGEFFYAESVECKISPIH